MQYPRADKNYRGYSRSNKHEYLTYKTESGYKKHAKCLLDIGLQTIHRNFQEQCIHSTLLESLIDDKFQDLEGWKIIAATLHEEQDHFLTKMIYKDKARMRNEKGENQAHFQDEDQWP